MKLHGHQEFATIGDAMDWARAQSKTQRQARRAAAAAAAEKRFRRQSCRPLAAAMKSAGLHAR